MSFQLAPASIAFPGAVPSSASLANLKAREKTRQDEKDQQSDRLLSSFAALLCGH